MRGPTIYLIFLIVIGAFFFSAISDTLTDMTRRDCRLGVQAACEQLQCGDVKP